jgi:hypothetical protein
MRLFLRSLAMVRSAWLLHAEVTTGMLLGHGPLTSCRHLQLSSWNKGNSLPPLKKIHGHFELWVANNFSQNCFLTDRV